MKKIFLKLSVFLFIFFLLFQKEHTEAAVNWNRCDNSSLNCTEFCRSRNKICVNRCSKTYDPQDKSRLFDKTSSYPKVWNNVGLFQEEAVYYNGWYPYAAGAGYCSDKKSPISAPPYSNRDLRLYCNTSFNSYCCCADTCEDMKIFGDANCDESINDVDYSIWRCEFLGRGRCQNPFSEKKANFNLDDKVDIVDFEIWRKNSFDYDVNPTPTLSITLTPTLNFDPPIICERCPEGRFCPEICIVNNSPTNSQ